MLPRSSSHVTVVNRRNALSGMEYSTDPVCGMEVKVRQSLWKTRLDKETFHFCSAVCKRTFDENVGKILDIQALGFRTRGK